MLSIHTDEPQTDFAATRQTAARCIGVHDNEVTDDDSEKTSVLPWVMACVGFWVIVGCAVFA